MVGKILESLVQNAVMKVMEVDNLLTTSQHGFTPGKSCTSQLLTIANEWTKLLDERKPIDVVYLNFRRTSESVPHERLLVKLAAYLIK